MKKGICPKCKKIKMLGYLGRCTDCNIKIEDELKKNYCSDCGKEITGNDCAWNVCNNCRLEL